MRMANDCLNQSPNVQHKSKLTAAQIFAKSIVNDNPIHKQPFGSPVYVLQSPLQNNLPFQKWKHRSKLGLYLGPSPVHARNISLILDLQTGHVSPQFHVVHDSTFQTVRNDMSKYQWSLKAGFERKASTSSTAKPQQQTTNSRPKKRKHAATNSNEQNAPAAKPTENSSPEDQSTKPFPENATTQKFPENSKNKLVAPNHSDIQQAINDIKKTGLNMTDKGTIEDFLGVNITYQKDRSIHFQPNHQQFSLVIHLL